MFGAKLLLMAGSFLATFAPQPPAVEVKMEQVGKTFVFDYGDLESIRSL